MLRLELGAQGARIAARRGCRARLERIVISGSDQQGRRQLLRRQGSSQAASERFFRRLRCTGGIAARQLIDTAIRNRSQEMAQVEAVSNKIIGQKAQYVGLAGRIGVVHLVDRLDQTPAKELRPNIIDGGTLEERLIAVD